MAGKKRGAEHRASRLNEEAAREFARAIKSGWLPPACGNFVNVIESAPIHIF